MCVHCRRGALRHGFLCTSTLGSNPPRSGCIDCLEKVIRPAKSLLFCMSSGKKVVLDIVQRSILSILVSCGPVVIHHHYVIISAQFAPILGEPPLHYYL